MLVQLSPSEAMLWYTSSQWRTPGDTVDLRMIDRTKSSTLLYQNTGIMDVITTVGQHISSLPMII